MGYNRLYKLIKWDFVIQNRINNLTKYLLSFFLFCTLSLTLINNHADIQKTGMIFSIICMPLALIGLSNLMLKQDLEDGSLELLLSNFSAVEIVIAKFFSIFISTLLNFIINLPIMFILFDIKLHSLILLCLTMPLLLMLSSVLLLLISSIQSYFKSNSYFLSILIMPLLIPDIILIGLILQNSNINLILIMGGINLIIMPIALIFSAYLIKNIYNI